MRKGGCWWLVLSGSRGGQAVRAGVQVQVVVRSARRRERPARPGQNGGCSGGSGRGMPSETMPPPGPSTCRSWGLSPVSRCSEQRRAWRGQEATGAEVSGGLESGEAGEAGFRRNQQGRTWVTAEGWRVAPIPGRLGLESWRQTRGGLGDQVVV